MRGFWVSRLLTEGLSENYTKLAVLSTFHRQIYRKMTQTPLFSPPDPHPSESCRDWVGQSWLTNKSLLYFFLAFSFPPEKWYSIWSLFNDPKWLKLHGHKTYCWGFSPPYGMLVWYGLLRNTGLLVVICKHPMLCLFPASRFELEINILWCILCILRYSH